MTTGCTQHFRWTVTIFVWMYEWTVTTFPIVWKSDSILKRLKSKLKGREGRFCKTVLPNYNKSWQFKTILENKNSRKAGCHTLHDFEMLFWVPLTC